MLAVFRFGNGIGELTAQSHQRYPTFEAALAAAAVDRGEDATRLARLAYDQTTRVALQVTDGAVQVFGGHGYIRDYLPELHLRNVAGFASFETLALV